MMCIVTSGYPICKTQLVSKTSFPIICLSNAIQKDSEDFLFLKKLADKGSTEAQIKIAFLYEKGKNIKHSYPLAFHYYQLAILATNDNDIKISLKKCINQYIADSPKEAFEYFEKMAKDNDPLAIYMLAQSFLTGFYAKKFVKNALEYYRKASRLGYPCDLADIASALLAEKLKKNFITQFLKSLIYNNNTIKAWQYRILA